MFNLNGMDKPEPIICSDPQKLFNDTIFADMSLFFVEQSHSGPLLRRNSSCFDFFRLEREKTNCQFSYIDRNPDNHIDSDNKPMFFETQNISFYEDSISLEGPFNIVRNALKNKWSNIRFWFDWNLKSSRTPAFDMSNRKQNL